MSNKPRNVLLCCYNAARNSPYEDGPHPRYAKLEKLPDAAVKEIGRRGPDARRAFYVPPAQSGAELMRQG